MLPLVTDIARGSCEDGPGLRSVVFFKGCPLRCVWCHNPETHERRPELMYFTDECFRCGGCEGHCPVDALNAGYSGLVNRSLCRPGEVCSMECCAGVCGANALRRVGKTYTHLELVEYLLRDKAFYDTSGGGVTFSGGEPLIHTAFLSDVCRALKENSVHIAVETCGHFPYDSFHDLVAPYVDLVLFDVKIADPMEHRRRTGKDNLIILKNLERLLGEEGLTVIPRIPLVPGVTALAENLEAIGSLLSELGFASCRVLSYNPSGKTKWLALGKAAPNDAPDGVIPFKEENICREILNNKLQPQ